MILAIWSWITLSYIANEAIACHFSPRITNSSTVRYIFLFTIGTCQRARSLRSLQYCQTIMQLLLSTAPHARSTECGHLMRPQYRTPFFQKTSIVLKKTFGSKRHKNGVGNQRQINLNQTKQIQGAFKKLGESYRKHPRLARNTTLIIFRYDITFIA